MSKKKTIQSQVDLESLKIISQISEGNDNDIKENYDLSIIVAQSLKKSFDALVNWTGEFINQIEIGNYKIAYNLLSKNKGTIRFLKKDVLENLLQLDSTVLEKEERKDFFLIVFAVAAKEINFGRIENELIQFLFEFEDDIEPVLKQSIILARANSAAQNGKLNVANINYKNILASFHTAAIDSAYAFRGLSKISTYPEDKINYSLQSVDKFLEAGIKNEAIKDLVHISKLIEKDNPEEALKHIDFAISLYDGTQALDKEFAASLYHSKAIFLYSLGETEQALESIELACVLRDGLMGNEYEKYSSFSSAKSFSQILKDEKKVDFYTRKIADIIPNINTHEFQLQQKIGNSINNNEKIVDELLIEIEESNFSNFKFLTYLHNAQNTSILFEEKIEWIDKAKIVLDQIETFNQYYSLLYFSLAEIYRMNDSLEESIKNYELSLEYNPRNSKAIQNCGAVLWKIGLWKKSLVFFIKQIERFGNLPNLTYALGRSYFELGNYQEAFNNFILVKGKVKGDFIQKYIDECIDKKVSLNLIPENLSDLIEPISLESFNKALEQFSYSVSSNSRMHFWKNIQGNYKWSSNPEEKGKQLLITALETKFGKQSIDIIQERRAGAGIIDLYIILKGGLKIVIELKICGGSGYSSNYALSGENQLIHYIKNTDTKIGYLIVFDGRIRDFNKGFKSIQTVDNVTIFTSAIDMRPNIN